MANYARNHDFRTAPESDFRIVIHTVHQALGLSRFIYGNLTTEVLNVIQTVSDAIHSIGGQKRITPGIDDDRSWIHALWLTSDQLSRLDKRKFRTLLHTLEKCCCNGFLTGSQENIREALHSSLEFVHEECSVCEDGADCPWIDHTCDGKYRSPGNDCTLLLRHRAASPLQPSAIGNKTVRDEQRSRSSEQAASPTNQHTIPDLDDSRSWSSQVALGWVYSSREILVDVEKGEGRNYFVEVDENAEESLPGVGCEEFTDEEERAQSSSSILSETRDTRGVYSSSRNGTLRGDLPEHRMLIHGKRPSREVDRRPVWRASTQ